MAAGAPVGWGTAGSGNDDEVDVAAVEMVPQAEDTDNAAASAVVLFAPARASRAAALLLPTWCANGYPCSYVWTVVDSHSSPTTTPTAHGMHATKVVSVWESSVQKKHLLGRLSDLQALDLPWVIK
jgi:hypothetical protein